MSASESHSAVVLELAEEFLERYRQGERPSLKEYIDRHPELAAEIREVFPAMALMENVALADESLAGAATGPASTTMPAAAPPAQLGDYRILRELGRGGMGIVYEAEQVSLGRHIALKVLGHKVLLDADQKRRFEREARAAARLHHTNIVPVFGVGEHDGLPYYVMQLIQGLGLDGVLAELKRMQDSGTSTTTGGELPVPRKDVSAADVAHSLLTGAFPGPMEGVELPQPVEGPPRAEDSSTGKLSSMRLPGSGGVAHGKGKKASYWQSVAQIGVQVAEALEYAHKQGIQHRDIKPSNLLLDTRGTVWVTDFGLARADNENHLTQTGDLVGTLRYMPPEAFEGRADKRGDIYSLGLTLYELLAFEPAFEDRDRHRLIKRLMTEEPERLDSLPLSIPRDLVTIVHKAIDREPGRRYQTAGELAADLQRFLQDEPIQARRISSAERFGRWWRHHPGVATLTVALAVVLLTVTVASLIVATRFEGVAREARLAEENERQARRAAVEAKDHEAGLRAQAEMAQTQAETHLHEAERQKVLADESFARARKAVDRYFTVVSESRLLQVPGLLPLRRDLLQLALTFYQDFVKERGNDPALHADLAAAFLRVGKIHEELGEIVASFQAYEQARTLYVALTKAEPASVDFRHGLAQCDVVVGRHEEAIALWEKLAQPGQPRFQSELAVAYDNRALNFLVGGKVPETLKEYERALAIREMLIRLNPDDTDAQRDLGLTLHNIGLLLDRKKEGGHAEALAMYRRAAAHVEVAFTQAPQVLDNARSLALVQNRIAVSERRLGHVNEVVTAYRRTVEVWRKVARDNPAVPNLYSQLFRAYRRLALYQREQKQTEQANRTMHLAYEVIDRLPNDGPEDLFLVACVRAECSKLLNQGIVNPTAEEQAEQQREKELALEALRSAIAAGFRDAARLRKATELNTLRSRDDFKVLEADLAARLAAPENKLKASQRILDLHQKLAHADPKNQRLRADLAASQHAIALLQIDRGKREEAKKHLQQAIALREDLAKDEPKNTHYLADLAASRFLLGECYWKSGRLKEAENLWRQVRPSLGKILEQEEKSAARKVPFAAMYRRMAIAYAEQCMWEQAAAALEAAFALQPDFPDGSLWFGRAALATQLEKTDHFRRICRDFVNLSSIRDHNLFLGRLNMLGAEAYPDSALAVTASQQVIEALGSTPWHRFVLGTAQYRAGHYVEAERLIRESMNPALHPDSQLAYRWFWLAMVCKHQGKNEEARQWLRKGVQWMERGKHEQRPEGHPDNTRWDHVLELHQLRREAQTLIEGK